MMDLRMPNITAATPQGQLEQVKSYLFQMVHQLNFAMKTVEDRADQAMAKAQGSIKSEVEQAQSTFSSIKSLIIKSADIVNAYYDIINAKLEGEYVAQSEFGTYKEVSELLLELDPNEIIARFNKVQEIDSGLNALTSQVAAIDSSAYIKCGELGYYTEGDNEGAPIIGVEVGQSITTKKEDGTQEETFHRYARFTAEKLSFFDPGDNEVAYFSNSTMYITRAEIKGNLKVGKFSFDTANGLALVWEGA